MTLRVVPEGTFHVRIGHRTREATSSCVASQVWRPLAILRPVTATSAIQPPVSGSRTAPGYRIGIQADTSMRSIAVLRFVGQRKEVPDLGRRQGGVARWRWVTVIWHRAWAAALVCPIQVNDQRPSAMVPFEMAGHLLRFLPHGH